MPAMNSRQAQVIDPILSTQARGYTNQEFIGHRILPFADIPNRSMKVIRFGKDAFRRYMNTRRAPGAETMRLQFGYASDPVALTQEALEALVPDEISGDAQRVPGIDLASVSINAVQDIIGLGREVEIAGMVRNAANYDANHKVALAGADKWSDPDSDPAKDVREAREAVRRSIGRYPNVLAIGPDVFNALSEHPKITARFVHTSSDSVTEAMLAKYFNLDEVIVGKAVALPDTAADTDLADDVWGNDALLFYRAGSNFLVPAFGYTYRLSGYPLVEQPYYERNRKSWAYPVTEEYRPYVTGAEGGFLFQGAA
ncbi:major capsid protein [Ancylobacter sp. A5.8]|uniref:major capsid protein n=1 Tax=Ancylobacter gelatini TaxID=2919920 RepID=UPI001F4E4409|nr:major capsid protein [Ancylobacter gelatini]MCJ8142961.1 major capsid protein [Ancylobacter gelatini]